MVSQTIALNVFEAFAAAALTAMGTNLPARSGPGTATTAVTLRPCVSKHGVPYEEYVGPRTITDAISQDAETEA